MTQRRPPALIITSPIKTATGTHLALSVDLDNPDTGVVLSPRDPAQDSQLWIPLRWFAAGHLADNIPVVLVNVYTGRALGVTTEYRGTVLTQTPFSKVGAQLDLTSWGFGGVEGGFDDAYCAMRIAGDAGENVTVGQVSDGSFSPSDRTTNVVPGLWSWNGPAPWNVWNCQFVDG